MNGLPLPHGDPRDALIDRVNLLHNMSAPAKTTVTYDGLRDLASSSGFGGSGVGTQTFAGKRSFGKAIRFELPRLFDKKTPAQILRSLKLGQGRAGEDAEERLADFINRRAASLPLPDGCVVIPVKASHQVIWDDGLTALAILAKCSDAIWLRSKDPAIAAALEMKQASLLVPPAFVKSLPEFLP